MAQYSEYGGGYGNDNEFDDNQQQQRGPPSQYAVRPMVDPEAEGEVDPNLWVFSLNFNI